MAPPFVRISSVQVILESLRMASIISFTFREAVTDVEYKGTHVHCGGRGAIRHHRDAAWLSIFPLAVRVVGRYATS
jgi:hypothetical protein